MKPLYAITSVFNPRRFQSRIRLYDEFAAWIKCCGVRLVTVEVAFGERPHAVVDALDPWHLRLASRNEIWHKERALNLGLWHLSQLDPGWEYVAWMDADIRLARPDWAREAVHLLQHYAVIQLFGEARILGPNHETLFQDASIAKNFVERGRMDWGPNPGVHAAPDAAYDYSWHGHPGMGWAFRRGELNDIGGWLDVCAAGSADLHMAGCFGGHWKLGLSPDISPGYSEAIRRYGALCDAHVRRNLSYMPGSADHYWHGRTKQRGYNDRWKLIDRYQFDPATDLVLDVQGLYRWNLDDPRVMALAVEIRKSLASRNEDVNEL